MAPETPSNPHPLSDFDLHLVNQGNHERLFDVLGCHLFEAGARFAVWAPNAQAVSVIGDFNGWAIGTTPLPLSFLTIWYRIASKIIPKSGSISL